MSEEIDTNKIFREEFKALRNDYIELQQENTHLKSVLKEIREYINNFPLIHYASAEKVDGKRLSGKLIPVDELLEIIDKGIGEDK